MINPQDPITVDLRSSCTKEEAVAKMIGWMRGHIHPEEIDVPQRQSSDVECINVRNITPENLEGQLELMREQARLKLIEAMDASDNFDDYWEEYYEVNKVDDLIKNVAFYLDEIADEAAKGKDSMLRVDQYETDKSGIPHYTLKSIDLWARENYDLPILDHPWSVPEAKEPSVNSAPEQKAEVAVTHETENRTGLPDQVPIITIHSASTASLAGQLMTANGNVPATQISPEKTPIDFSEGRDKEGRLRRASADSLYTTLAITVQAYAATLEEIYQLDTSNPTVAEIRSKFIDDNGKPIAEILHKKYFDDNDKPKETQFVRSNNDLYIAGIAKHLVNVGIQLNKRPNRPSTELVPISCQKEKSIIIRITDALPLLNQALSKS